MNLKERVQKELAASGKSYRTLANQIGVSPGVITYILADDPPRTTTTLRKFAAYFKIDLMELMVGGSLADPPGHYAVAPPPSPAWQRLLDEFGELDQEEKDALLRCANLLHRGDRETRQHLIGLLKIIGAAPRKLLRPGKNGPIPGRGSAAR
jgi:transcriptional regulator with XRE-family HTH domain